MYVKTITYSRTVNLGNYNSNKLEETVETCEADWEGLTTEEQETKYNTIRNELKASVCDFLGLEEVEV